MAATATTSTFTPSIIALAVFEWWWAQRMVGMAVAVQVVVVFEAVWMS